MSNLKNAKSRLITAQGYGTEPAATDFSQNKTEYIRALTWYRVMLDSKDYLDWIEKLLIFQGRSTAFVANVKRGLTDDVELAWLASVAKMILNDCILPPESVQRADNIIAQAATTGGIIKTTKYEGALTIVEKTKNKAMEFTAEIDQILDQYDIVNWNQELKRLNIKGNHAKHIIAFYQGQHDDIKNNIADYRNIDTKKRLATFAELIKALKIAASDRSITTKQVIEATNKKTTRQSKMSKKAKASKSPASSFKYKAGDVELAIKSVKPESIIDAVGVVLYNCKYKVLTIIKPTDGQKLNIKGTTVINGSEQLSYSKRCGRVASKLLPVIAKASISQASKAIDNIKSDKISYSSRGTEDVLIIRVFK